MAEFAYPALVTLPTQAQQYSSTNSNLGLVTPDPPDSCRVGNGKCGEAIEAVKACRFDANGLIWKSSGAANDANAVVDGWTLKDYQIGETATLYTDVEVGYGSSVTCAAFYYLSGTVTGGLNTAATTGGINPIARGVPDNSLNLNAGAKRHKLRVKQSY